MSTMTVRPARPEDLEAAGEITARAYVDGGHIHPQDDDYLPKLRDAATRAERAELLVAVDGDKVLGSVTLARHGEKYAEVAWPGEMEFRMLAVAPEAAGRGTGRALALAVLDRARAEGCKRVALCSQESMTAAHHIYRGLGFERAPHRDWEPRPGIRLLTFTLKLE